MRLLIDAVGIYYSIDECQKLVYELVNIVFDKLSGEFSKKKVNMILITDKSGGERYLGKVARCLSQLKLYPASEKVGGGDCPYTCLCREKKPNCGKVGEHEVYAAPCSCNSDDWLLMAKCCCKNFSQGVFADYGALPGCRRLDGESVAGCFHLFKCPRGITSGT